MTSPAIRPDTAFFRVGRLIVTWVGAGAAFVAGAAEAGPVATTTSCCNVVELRQYTLQPGRREIFIDLFDRTFADPLDATGMTVIGQFRDLDNPLRFVWLRGFQDMTMRAQELSAFYDGALWHAHRDEANASIVDSDNVLLLEPASTTRHFEAPPARASAVSVSGNAGGGIIVATLYYTRAEALADFGALFDRSLLAPLERAGATTVAVYQTSTQANNFPRLPVRTGEHILVWISRFDSADSYAHYRTRLARDRQWDRAIWPAASELLVRDPEVLRLSPTSRSRLRADPSRKPARSAN